GERQPGFLLFSNELHYVHRAVVAVKGWHTTTRFTPRLIESSSEVLKFLEQNVLKTAEEYFQEAEEAFQSSDLHKILVLPGLPTAEPHRSESIRLVREKGVDGIISFRAMLGDILAKVEVN